MIKAGRCVASAAVALGAAALVAGCGSSGGGGAAPTISASVPVVAPTTSPAGTTGTVLVSPGSGGGSASAFCHEFTSADLSSLYDTTKAGQVAKLWDKLTADAPAAISGDMKTVDDYLHTVAGGNPVPPGSDVATAIGHVTRWVGSNCATA